MRRTVEKHIRLTEDEARDLREKAKRCNLTESALIRLLIQGYEPKEKPDDRFYETMRQLSSIGNNINQLAAKANSLGFIDKKKLEREIERWHQF